MGGEAKLKQMRKQIDALETGTRVPSAKSRLVELNLPPSGYVKTPCTSVPKGSRGSPSSGSTTARSNSASQGTCMSSHGELQEAGTTVPQSARTTARTPLGSHTMPLSA